MFHCFFFILFVYKNLLLLFQLDNYLSVACHILHALIKGNVLSTRQQMSVLLEPLRRLVNSPLGSSRVCKLLIELSTVAFSNKKNLGRLVLLI